MRALPPVESQPANQGPLTSRAPCGTRPASREPVSNKDVEVISRLIICTPMEDLPFQIAETAHALRKSFDRRASVLGVTRAQWKVLLRLTRMPGLRQVELADMLDVEPITLSRIVDRLEGVGHVAST